MSRPSKRSSRAPSSATYVSQSLLPSPIFPPIFLSGRTNGISLQYTIAHRADALFIAKNLKLRYFHECSEAHFNEFQRLVGEEGMSIDEACAAHSDFGAWMASEKIERQRDLSPEEAEADVERIMARLRL